MLQLVFFLSIVNIRYIISLSQNLNKERKMFHNIQYKRTHILLTIVQIILVGMILGWYYFSERKMGMIRNILFRNVYKFPKYFTNTNIKMLLAIIIVFALIQLVLVIKSKKFVLTFIINLALILGLGYIVLDYNADKAFIYYYIIIFCGLFNLTRFLQFLTLKFK